MSMREKCSAANAARAHHLPRGDPRGHGAQRTPYTLPLCS
jgi:hypothetical protein